MNAGTAPSGGTLRSWLSTPDARGRDRMTRILVWMVVAVMIGILALLGYAIWQVTRTAQAPRTEMERQLFVLESLTRGQQADPKVWADYAAALIDSQQYALASQTIERGLAATHSDPLVMLQRARLFKAQGRTQEAIAEASRVVVAANKAREVQLKALTDKGIRVPAGALASEPIIGAQLLRAELMEQLLRWSDAVKAYTAALAENPQMSDVLAARGNAYIKLKLFERARADFQHALKLIPDYKPALVGLATVKKETGK